MTDIKQYLEDTNTVLVTKELFEYLKDRASVLDKIRAEIEQIELLASYTRGDIKQIALDIIDKYKGDKE